MKPVSLQRTKLGSPFGRAQLVEKGHRPFPTKELHDRQDSISCEKVALSVMGSVVSEVHAPGNNVDWILFRHLRMTELGETCLNPEFFDSLGSPFGRAVTEGD